MKKIIAIMMVFVMLISLTACDADIIPMETEFQTRPQGSAQTELTTTYLSQSENTSEELVIYISGDQHTIDAYIPSFEEATGIHVKIVSGGTGELLKRIEAEAENPQGDVEFGGVISLVLAYKEYFEPYVSIHNDRQIEACKAVEGFINCYNILPMCIVVNSDLIGDLEINGYEDLLAPELKGQIAFVDPVQSSTGIQQLTAMLAAIGNGDDEKGWDFVEKFIDNLDGRLLSSSSAVGQGVAVGEFIVGLTHEGYITTLINSGYNVKAVYPEEGMFVSASTVQIIKGCKNLENAKLFVDYVTSYDVQVRAVELLQQYGTRVDVPAPKGMEDLSNANIIVEDVYNTLENSESNQERFKDLYQMSR